MSLQSKKSPYVLYGIFALAIMANIFFWSFSKNIRVGWNNVPPAPSHVAATFAGLGDAQVTYRMFGYILQNLGNSGGEYRSLKDYDYAELEKWFFVSQKLDPAANYVPYLAAYYFGAIEDEPEKISHVARYLAEDGMAPYNQKWRWLAQAIYLAQHKANDPEWALTLANKLAAMDQDLPPWARQMPAFIQMRMGNKQASYEIMVRMLATEGEKLHPNEVNAMKDFICTRTLEPDEAAKNPLCQNPK